MIKFTKKNISITRNKVHLGIVIAVTLALLLLIIFDSSIFASKETITYMGRRAQSLGILNGEEPLVQPFVPDREHVDYIEIRMATNVEEGNILEPVGYLQFQVLGPKSKVLYTEQVPIKDLKDNEYRRFKVNLDLDPTIEYKITMQVFDTIGEEVPTVWVSSNVKDALRNVVYPGVDPEVRLQSVGQFRYSHMNYSSIVVSVLLILLCSFLSLIKVDLSEKGSECLTMAVLFTMPVLMFVIVELLNNNSVLLKETPVYVINYIFYLLVYILFFIAFNRFRLTTIIINSFVFVVAVFNYFKLLWRGEPIQLWDIVTLKTAMNVSDNYHIELSPILFIATLLFILSILLISKCKYSFILRRTRVSLGAVGMALTIFLVMALFDTDRYQITAFSLMQRLGIVNNVWNQPSNFSKNGMLIALTMNAQYITVRKPDNYSGEKLQECQGVAECGYEYNILPNEVLAEYEANKAQHQSEGQRVLAPGQLPNIICIMNESYTDLSTVGSFETNLPMHPYMDALFEGENIIHGDLCVSTYGGGTANSEFEFLTGNSMTFFPNGSIPYQQYVDSPTGCLPRFLKSLGYSAIAVHPYLASGWNRPDVYENMAFDDFISIDDFNDNAEYIRSYISDRCSYDKLIELYEKKAEGQPIFLFNVTMQNHGSYTSTNPNFNQDVKLTDYPDKFPETEQYLTLARQSDIAVDYLIQYFQNTDEPVIICFFGDHLPSMKNGFYETLLGKELVDLSGEEMQRLYKTDYFIWANFDIPECEMNDLSLNYLSTLLLQTSGIHLPDYNILIAQAHEEYPTLTTMGIYDANGVRYNTLNEIPDKDGILNLYNIMAYNNVFETTGRSSGLFDIINTIPWHTEAGDYIAANPTAGTGKKEEEEE
ncbi:MAG: sulfatase-like hydrolase/transferase [Clostridiales bacterium]|nr:sulfatase-like hydrolase/transferase [Clostridiales bacterium]